VARFSGERAAFLKRTFSSAKVGRTWHTLELPDPRDPGATAERERIVKALAYLEEQGDLDLRASGVRQGYRVARVPEDLAGVWKELCRRFEARERNDITRLRAVPELLEGRGCLVRRLLAYFGEELGRDCGHCGACAGDAPVRLGRAATPAVDVPARELQALRIEHPRALQHARQVARFLCGLTSPALAAAKLTRHPRFGDLAGAPFPAVIARAEREVAGGAKS